MIKKILFTLILLFIAIQFIRPSRNNGIATTEKDITHYVHVSDTVMNLLKRSCYDCHSNHTDYPWYADINPVGIWLNNHIKDGKRAINFSDLSAFSKKKFDHRLGDIKEQLEKKEMPLSSYTLIHRYAILSEAESKLLSDWSDSARRELGYQDIKQ